MKDKNPINKDEELKKSEQPERILPNIESDTNFSDDEQRKIVEMVLQDVEVGKQVQAEWLVNKKRDVQHLNSEKPSVIEGLNKKSWQSDRNLGLAAGISDIYQATLLATCWNPDSIHFTATETNDIDNKDNLVKFTKWMVSPQECDVDDEIDDFVNNKANLGWSVFKVKWDVWYEMVDKRIPIYSKENKRRVIGYDLVEEERRFEGGRIVNIDELDDILIPDYGKHIQKLSFIIERLHLTTNDLEDYSERKVILNYSENKLKISPSSNMITNASNLKREDQKFIGESDQVMGDAESEKRNKNINVYEWYGKYRKNGKNERYRFWVEPESKVFLSGKPLRKIKRDGKYPYVGRPLRRRPGFVRGGSLMTLIAPVINAINNTYNQKSDFQFFQNCPFGFYDKNQDQIPDTLQDMEPMKMEPVDGNPAEKVFFPNIQRSLAWSYQDTDFLMMILERLTGAASYFLASDSKDTTATRDKIVEQKGEVKFGLWVKRIQSDISEGLNMLVQMYQDWAPPDLAKRVIGEDGKAIIKNLSINSLRGGYDVYLTPDISSGSRAYERQVKMWGFQVLQQGSVWFDPRINPRGNWMLTKEAMKSQGYTNADNILPPQPKDKLEYSKEALNHFNQIKQGDIPTPPEPNNPQIVECVATFGRLKETRYQEIDEEDRKSVV